MPPSSMKPTHVSVRTHRGMTDRTPAQDQTLFFDLPCPDTKYESKQNRSTEKITLPKPTQQNARKPRPGNDDDNELIKYMSNLPCFLQQQMEKESNVQDKALNFGVLDWKRLEKWKYTERMPGKHSSQKKQSSSHVRNPSSGKIPGPHGLRFGSPHRRQNEEEYYRKEDKYTELTKSIKRTEARVRDYQTAEIVGAVRRQDNFHQSVKRKDPKKEVLEKEASPKPKHVQKHSSEGSQFMEPRLSLDGQKSETTGNRLSDFLSPQVLKYGELSIDKSREEAPEHITTPKERPSSPMRRLSFDLGRMSRSLSFKENPAPPQLSPGYTSIKSGPARPEISPSVDKFKKTDQVNPSSRARSSPLRRLLDPLLKQKGPETVSSAGIKIPETNSYISQDKKPVGSNLQALLQLTLNNGLPFLKLVVKNSNDMLAASVKSLPGYRKIDACSMTYVFYSVHEIRKKNTSWINQGSKGKSCGLGYSVVGQMNISLSSDSKSRECVLYGVDPGQLENQTIGFVPKKEVAAVIVPNKERENKSSSGSIVILADGVHGVPSKGEPSSLVSRFGGGCDCGGWDVGCKLRLLVDDKKGRSSLQESMVGSTDDDRFSLYLEGGEKGKKPVFSLKSFSNGYYSVEFDASISLLEVFATCVAHVTCVEFPEIAETKNLSKKGHFSESTEEDKRKSQTKFQEQLPGYVSCPPLSPVGRI